MSLTVAFGSIELIARVALPPADPSLSAISSYGLSDGGDRYYHVCDHGSCANSGTYAGVTKSIEATNESIYSVRYTIGQNNLRVTPVVNASSDFLVRYFGGSFVFGEGLNDTETLSYYSQLASSKVRSENFGFHGYGVHNALKILKTLEKTEGSANLLLTGTFHAFRSACIPQWSSTHPFYELIDGELLELGKCSEKEYKGWVQSIKKKIDEISYHVHFRSLAIISEYLASCLTSYQIDLYKSLIQEFYHLSLSRRERPVVLYITDPKRSYITAGYRSDPMPDYFIKNGIDFVDVTLPDEPDFYLHMLDRHPSAYANCERIKIIFEYLGLNLRTYQCD